MSQGKKMLFLTKYNGVLALLESRIENLMESFQMALHKQQNTNTEGTVFPNTNQGR